MKKVYNKNRYPGLLIGMALLVFTVSPLLAEPSDLGNPGIIPPQAKFRGLTYSEWQEEWFKWVFSLPVSGHPLLDTADCDAGQ